MMYSIIYLFNGDMQVHKIVTLDYNLDSWGQRGILHQIWPNFQLPTIHQSILKSVKVSENSDMKYIHLLCVRFMDFFVGVSSSLT